MTTPAHTITRLRLAAQHLLDEPAASPAEAVRALGAVQSQEFRYASWSLGRRAGASEAQVRADFDAGLLLRAHAMRPTWHFLHPDDVRWIQEFTRTRGKAQMAGVARKNGITDDLVTASHRVFERAVADGHRTRAELGDALAADGIRVDGWQLGYLAMLAEYDNLLTSGAIRGKQHTYALLDERASGGRRLEGDEALAELAWLYVSGHGPATDRDLAWWANLTLTEARAGLHLVRDRLEQVTLDGVDYLYAAGLEVGRGPLGAHLLPVYDEYVVAFQKQSRGLVYPPGSGLAWSHPNAFAQPIVHEGRAIGWWKSADAGARHVLELHLAASPTEAQRRDLDEEVRRYAAFLGREVEVEYADEGTA